MGILYSNITLSEASNIVMNNVVAEDEGYANVYVYPYVVNGFIQTLSHPLNLPYDNNWVFFIDDNVFADWIHLCRYVFVNVENGVYQIVNEYIYPANLSSFNLISGVELQLTPYTPETSSQSRPNRAINPRLYAILVCGFYDQWYWNNISSMYCTLTQEYGYDPNNVIVLFYNGQSYTQQGYNCTLDLDGIPPNDIDGSAYHDDFYNAFTTTANLMNSRPNPELNQFFFYYSGHGYDPAHSLQGPIYSFALCYENPNTETRRDVISSGELDALLDIIPCSQQMIGLTQCYSGGFIADLTSINRTIITSAASSEVSFNEKRITGQNYAGIDGPGYNEFYYYLTAAIRGFYPGLFAYSHGSDTGTFPFDQVDNLNVNGFIHPPDRHPDLSPFGDGDGIVQLEEAYKYARYYDIMSHDNGYPGYSHFNNTDCFIPYDSLGILEEHPEINCLTGIHDIQTLSGIAFKSEEQSFLNGNILLSEEGIEILDGGSLTIASGSKIYLPGESRIIINEGASINIGHNVTFIGSNPTVNDIPGNRIEVYGSINMDENVHFVSEPTHTWDGLYVYGSTELNITQVEFNGCNLHIEGGSLILQNSSMTNAQLSCINAPLTVKNCPNLGGIYCYHSEFVEITNDFPDNTYTLTGQTNGIVLENCGNYTISGYHITNNPQYGICIYESEGIAAECIIRDCVILYNMSGGIRFYHASAQVIGCTISGNLMGIEAIRCGNVEVFKDPETEPWDNDSIISNNILQEIVFWDDCDFVMDEGRNKIIDGDFNPLSFDQYLIHCVSEDPEHHMFNNRYFRNNYWGSDQWGNPVIPDESRFYPPCINPEGDETGYFIEPIWEPGQPWIITSTNVRSVYYSAVDMAIEENTDGAIYLFKQIIDQYPESEYATMSAKNLINLEENYLALKTYYATEPNLHWNGEIDKLADYLENYCNIKMGDYQAAITWFEAVISNPPSEMDSLLAVIDLGYVYLLMQENAPKASITCMYPQLKPKSRSAYITTRDDMLANIYNQVLIQPDDSYSIPDNMPSPVLDKNFPNPFNSSTTISYTLPKEMQAELAIYNLKGQKIRSLVNGNQAKGMHSVVWNGTDDSGKHVSSGIYFSKLITSGKVITSKLIMLK
jgi:parallel beta-helix repeat protein